MKILLSKNQFIKLINEQVNDYDDLSSLNSDMYFFVFNSILNKKKIKFKLLNPIQYKRALMEFIKYGELIKFPIKIIEKWKQDIIYNSILLSVLTDINGHGEYFPFDHFNDVFNLEERIEKQQYNLFTGEADPIIIKGDYDKWREQRYNETKNKEYLIDDSFHSVIEYLDEVLDMDEYIPFFSNGQPVLSDYGIEPIFKLIKVLIYEDDPNQILVIINKILDVAHQRSDLPEIFIEGGSKSQWEISNT